VICGWVVNGATAIIAHSLDATGATDDFRMSASENRIADRGFQTLYIAPGSPWENPYRETFNSRFRDEFLNRESFVSVLEAKVLGEEYRRDYNCRRPHSALGLPDPRGVCAAQPCGSLRHAPAAGRLCAIPKTTNHKQRNQNQHQILITSGSKTGGTPITSCYLHCLHCHSGRL